MVDGMPGRSRPVLSDGAGFWVLAGLLGLMMFAAGAPSPLYGVYAARWHFSSAMVTVIFALYAIALLVALLVAGRLSDYRGRRRVILAALVVEMAAMLCFIVADSTAVLWVARVLQGLATGGAIGALSAALVELAAGSGRSLGAAAVVNSAAPTVGLAAGALGTSLLVQYGPAPMRLVYWLLLGAFVLGAGAVAVMREPVKPRVGAIASLVPAVGVPRPARPAFAKALPCLIALWALGGFYLSLGPQLASTLARSENLLWGGVIIFLLTGSGALATILGRRSADRSAMLYGCGALFAGVAVTLVAVLAESMALLLVGSVIAGVGFGLAFLGAFRTLSALAEPAERAGMIAVIYIVSYLAFSIPVIVAGIAATSVGLHDVAIIYAAVVAALAALAMAISRPARLARPTPTTAPRAVADLPPCPGTVPLCIHKVAPEAHLPAAAGAARP